MFHSSYVPILHHFLDIANVGRRSPVWTYLNFIWRPCRGWYRWNFAEVFGARKLGIPGLLIVWHYLHDPMFSRFGTVPACDRQIDVRTDTHSSQQRRLTTRPHCCVNCIGSRFQSESGFSCVCWLTAASLVLRLTTLLRQFVLSLNRGARQHLWSAESSTLLVPSTRR